MHVILVFQLRGDAKLWSSSGSSQKVDALVEQRNFVPFQFVDKMRKMHLFCYEGTIAGDRK